MTEPVPCDYREYRGACGQAATATVWTRLGNDRLVCAPHAEALLEDGCTAQPPELEGDDADS